MINLFSSSLYFGALQFWLCLRYRNKVAVSSYAKHLEEALKIYMDGDSGKYRNLLDNLRFALEQLLRKVLGNKKSLENQKIELLNWLKKRGIHQQVVNLYNQLVFGEYRLYHNDAVKHGEAFSEDEIEFMIYLTGTFMRLLLKLS